MSRLPLVALLITIALELASSQPNLTPEQKKQSFMQTLDLLGKDTKVKYNKVMAELKSKINSEPNPKIKTLGEKMLSNIEGGEYYDNLGRLRQVIMADVMNAKLNADETAKVIILAQDFMEKFQNVFGKFIS